MGLGNDNNAGATYLTVAFGKINKRVKMPTETSVSRTLTKGPNAGNTVHEEQYSTLEGTITGISKKDSDDYGSNWIIEIQDGPDEYLLQLPYDGGTARGILHRLPNTDFKRPVTIHSWLTEKDGKSKTVLWMTQDGEKIPSAYTKEDPNGLPPMREIKRNGKREPDFTDQLEFLEEMVAGLKFNVLPKSDARKPAAAAKANDATGDDEPDLPF